jgi:hypothetical protein
MSQWGAQQASTLEWGFFAFFEPIEPYDSPLIFSYLKE